MTRHGARVLFGLGVVSVIAVFAAVGAAALTPKSAARIEARDVALVTLASLRDRIPAFVTMHDDFGLDVKARDRRSRGLYHPMGGRAHMEELPVWVVKSGSSVRAIYGIAGEHLGGPSPWTLDELVVSVRGDIVYADRHTVLPGQRVLR